MNPLSNAQWRMLKAAAIEPVSLDANMNTMSALYTRGVVKFVGRGVNRGIAPTKLGSTYLYMYKAFDKYPSFKQSRDKIREYR